MLGKFKEIAEYSFKQKKITKFEMITEIDRNLRMRNSF